jgi:DNA polymerase-1
MYEVIEREGHFVNLEKFHKTEEELKVKLELTEAKLNRTLGRAINWNSPAQVAKALYGDLGLIPKVFTDKNAPSTGEAALAELNHPIVDILIEYRSHQKFLSTYIEGWKEYMVGPYLYLGTKLHGTVTGRYSSRLHQVPRDGTIRNLIEAPPGWTFVQGDLSQAELRVAAIVSGDPELIRCYAENIDVHWRTTIGVLRLGGSDEDLRMARETAAKYTLTPPENIMEVLDLLERLGPDTCVELDKRWKEKRKQSKGINFGYLYGMGAMKFCEYAKLRYDWEVPVHQSQDIRNGFFATYAQLQPWHERQRELVRIDGFVRSLSGRKRRLPGIWSPDKMMKAECERQAINSPVQGFIGDLKVMGMLDIYYQLQVPTHGEKIRIKGEVHDAILMWIKTEHLQEMLPLVKQCMEKPTWLDNFGVKLPVPIVADLEVGPWGAGKPWKG